MIGVKRMASVVLAIILALSLASCKGDEPASAEVGSWSSDGKTFSNKWSKIQFKLPSGYRSATEAEIGEVYSSSKAVAETMGESGSATQKVTYDLLAFKDPEMIPQLMMLYENLGDSSESITTETYFSSMAKQFNTMVNSGITYIETDSQKVNLAGHSWDSKTYSVNGASGEAVQQYLLYKQGNYMVTILLTSEAESEDEAQVLLKGFSSAK
jgi:uncharacterized lipoprotein YehR (DUF1307 family)